MKKKKKGNEMKNLKCNTKLKEKKIMMKKKEILYTKNVEKYLEFNLKVKAYTEYLSSLACRLVFHHSFHAFLGNQVYTL